MLLLFHLWDKNKLKLLRDQLYRGSSLNQLIFTLLVYHAGQSSHRIPARILGQTLSQPDARNCPRIMWLVFSLGTKKKLKPPSAPFRPWGVCGQTKKTTGHRTCSSCETSFPIDHQSSPNPPERGDVSVAFNLCCPWCFVCTQSK